jgi:hypothetical protein
MLDRTVFIVQDNDDVNVNSLWERIRMYVKVLLNLFAEGKSV